MIDKSLPGSDLIEQGIADLQRGHETEFSLLVSIGWPKLRRGGVELPEPICDEPEQRLYLLLARDDPDTAHSRYNALVRRLVSFEQALGCAG